MQEASQEEKIEIFWKWFLETEAAIRAYFSEDDEGEVDKKQLIESINNNVLEFGLFAWEIGPGQSKPYHFTISPNGNRERLKLSKAIMRTAPELREWEFNPARPARPDRLQFSLYDNYMIEQEVDAAGWRCVLLKKADRTAAILLEANTIGNLDEDTQRTAGEMLITNLLGEEAKIRYVSKIEVVTELEKLYQGRSFSIRELGERVDGLVR